MKKALILACATAVLGTSSLIATPAKAMWFLLPVLLESKKDPNFHATNPYEAKKVVRHHKRHKRH